MVSSRPPNFPIPMIAAGIIRPAAVARDAVARPPSPRAPSARRRRAAASASAVISREKPSASVTPRSIRHVIAELRRLLEPPQPVLAARRRASAARRRPPARGGSSCLRRARGEGLRARERIEQLGLGDEQLGQELAARAEPDEVARAGPAARRAARGTRCADRRRPRSARTG